MFCLNGSSCNLSYTLFICHMGAYRLEIDSISDIFDRTTTSQANLYYSKSYTSLLSISNIDVAGIHWG